jgi:hypothetical protein
MRSSSNVTSPIYRKERKENLAFERSGVLKKDEKPLA